jgi:hypothetical protein
VGSAGTTGGAAKHGVAPPNAGANPSKGGATTLVTQVGTITAGGGISVTNGGTATGFYGHTQAANTQANYFTEGWLLGGARYVNTWEGYSPGSFGTAGADTGAGFGGKGGQGGAPAFGGNGPNGGNGATAGQNGFNGADATGYGEGGAGGGAGWSTNDATPNDTNGGNGSKGADGCIIVEYTL